MHEIVALKWRPRLFSEVIGQEHITETLKYAVRNGRIAPVYLFTGIRGTGKTTLARIMVKSLNCTNRSPEGEPCNRCESCLEIMGNRNPDIIEIDGASHNTVDDVRNLKETISYGPVKSLYRAYIIDEVHMLSKAAFNALLKTLEEPPKNTVFILATTDPQKIPATVLSRCQRYDLKRLSVEQIARQLRKIVESEGVTYDSEALYMIAREGAGSMRDAQTLLEQLITFGEGHITSAKVASILGSSDAATLRTLVESMIRGDSAQAVATVRALYQDGRSLEKAAVDILYLLHGIILLAELKSTDLLDSSAEEIEWMHSILSMGSRADWLRLFRFWSQETDKIRQSDFTAILMEVSVITAASFPTMSDLRGLYDLLQNNNKIEELAQQLSKNKTVVHPPHNSKKQTTALSPQQEQNQSEIPPQKTESAPIALNQSPPTPHDVSSRQQEISPQQKKTDTVPDWVFFLSELKKQSEVIWGVLHTIPFEQHGMEIHLFEDGIRGLVAEEQMEVIQSLFTRLFGQQAALIWHREKKQKELRSQRQIEEEEHKQDIEQRKQKIRNDTVVSSLIEQLGFDMEEIKAK